MDDRQSALLLFEEAMGYTFAAALRAAVTIGVADQLAAGPRTAAELAAAAGAQAPALHRILRLLATRDVFHEDDTGRFHLADKGRALRSDSPVSARDGVLMLTDTMFWTMTHELPISIRQAEPSFAALFGVSLAEYFDNSAEKESLYYNGMEAVSEAENPLVAARIDLPDKGTVADIGGRYGALLAAVLHGHPGLRGILFDNERQSLERHRLGAADLAGRWATVHGDFLDGVPPADIYLLKRIIHNFDDKQSVRILDNCRRGLSPGGRIFVIDAIIPPGNEQHQSKSMDLMMLAALTGQERTETELRDLFEAAGLRLDPVVRTDSVVSIAEGHPATA